MRWSSRTEPGGSFPVIVAATSETWMAKHQGRDSTLRKKNERINATVATLSVRDSIMSNRMQPNVRERKGFVNSVVPSQAP